MKKKSDTYILFWISCLPLASSQQEKPSSPNLCEEGQ